MFKTSYIYLTLLLLILVTTMVRAEQAFLAPLAHKSMLLDLETASDTTLFAVGERGHILRLKKGQTWQQMPVPTSVTLTAVQFYNAQQGWAVGHDATILYTADGGDSWQIQFQSAEIGRPLMDIHFFSSQHGIAVGAFGLFMRTQDGGQSWQRETHLELLLPDDKEYLDELKDEDPEMYDIELSYIQPHINHLSEEKGGIIYLAGDLGLVAYSDDQGKSWNRQDVGYYGPFFNVEADSDGQWWAVGLRGQIYVSQPSWQPLESATNSTLNGILFIPDKGTFIVGNSGTQMLVSSGEMQTWYSKQRKAIMDAVLFDQNVIVVTETGIETLSL